MTEGNASSNVSDEGGQLILQYISEGELIDFIKNKAIKKYMVFQNEDLSYRLVVNLTWKEGDFCLANTRKQPRNWASLDTLIRHIQKQGFVRSIQIFLVNQGV